MSCRGDEAFRTILDRSLRATLITPLEWTARTRPAPFAIDRLGQHSPTSGELRVESHLVAKACQYLVHVGAFSQLPGRVMNHGGIVGGQHLQQFRNRMSGWV
jgi:hypothetical protein